MPVSNELKANYEAVLRDLETQRLDIQQQIAPLQARLKELHGTILTLSKNLNPDSPLRLIAPLRPANQRYANISVRWAILDLLNQSSDGMSTAEIAEALKAAGVQTRAANFANNVSAVLTSTMQKDHNEVEQLVDGRWKLTANGSNAIEYIRTTPKFRRAWSA